MVWGDSEQKTKVLMYSKIAQPFDRLTRRNCVVDDDRVDGVGDLSTMGCSCTIIILVPYAQAVYIMTYDDLPIAHGLTCALKIPVGAVHLSPCK
jgi:hypothetical protein